MLTVVKIYLYNLKNENVFLVAAKITVRKCLWSFKCVCLRRLTLKKSATAFKRPTSNL